MSITGLVSVVMPRCRESKLARLRYRGAEKAPAFGLMLVIASLVTFALDALLNGPCGGPLSSDTEARMIEKTLARYRIVEQVGQGRLVEGHRVRLLREPGKEHVEDHAMAPFAGGPRETGLSDRRRGSRRTRPAHHCQRLALKPHHSRGHQPGRLAVAPW